MICPNCGVHLLSTHKSETRMKMFDHIEANPGISITQLAKDSDRTWTTTSYHVNILKKSKLIVKRMKITFGLGIPGNPERSLLYTTEYYNSSSPQ